MPLTLSHPAAILPLRKYLPLSALVIGSMSPDCEYPLRLAAISRFSHTLPAVLYFCVPVGFLLLFLFHRLIKDPALCLLPAFVRSRIDVRMLAFEFWPISRCILILLALAMGALTHIWWDAFTHEYGYVVERVPLLQQNALIFAGHELPWFKLLQYISSVTGLLILSGCFVWWVRWTPKVAGHECADLPTPGRPGMAICILLLTLLSGVSLGLWSALSKSGTFAFQVFCVQTMIGGMLGFAVSLFAYSILVWVGSPRITTR